MLGVTVGASHLEDWGNCGGNSKNRWFFKHELHVHSLLANEKSIYQKTREVKTYHSWWVSGRSGESVHDWTVSPDTTRYPWREPLCDTFLSVTCAAKFWQYLLKHTLKKGASYSCRIGHDASIFLCKHPNGAWAGCCKHRKNTYQVSNKADYMVNFSPISWLKSQPGFWKKFP